MIHVHLLVSRFQKNILLIVQYKYLRSFSEDFMLQNLILHTRLCGTGLITQLRWLFHFHPTKMVGRKCFVPLRYYPEVPRGILGGLALEQFWMIHRVGQVYRFVPFLPSEVPGELVCKMWVCCVWNVSRSSSWGYSFINIMDLCQELDGQLFAAHHPYAFLNSWDD